MCYFALGLHGTRKIGTKGEKTKNRDILKKNGTFIFKDPILSDFSNNVYTNYGLNNDFLMDN